MEPIRAAAEMMFGNSGAVAMIRCEGLAETYWPAGLPVFSRLLRSKPLVTRPK